MNPHPFTEIKIGVPTKHKKGAAIAKGFQEHIKVNIEEVDVDTDLLGTFAGEVEREGSPYETAFKKTELVTNYDYVIASEGSIGSDNFVPFLISDFEILIFRDFRRNLVIKEAHRSFEIKAARKEISAGEKFDDFLNKADFPNHSVIVKGLDLKMIAPFKGLCDLESLDKAIFETAKHSDRIILENDLRANQSPSRMANIEFTARKLAQRIAALCESCQTPGFGVKRYEKGVICEECKRLNPDAVSREINGCQVCDYEEVGAYINQGLTPDKCIWCNP